MVFDNRIELFSIGKRNIAIGFGFSTQRFVFGIEYRPNIKHECQHCNSSMDVFELFIGPFCIGLEIAITKYV